MTMSFYVYILASKKNGTLYVGMTDDLAKPPAVSASPIRMASRMRGMAAFLPLDFLLI